MRHHHVSPAYTEQARTGGVGRRDTGLVPAFFQMVDGELTVVTDGALATHSWTRFRSRIIVEPYRSDSTMVLGNGLTTLMPVNIPDSDLGLLYWPGSDWLEFVPVFSRAAAAQYLGLVPEILVDFGDDSEHSRASVASYLGSI